jgi:hypothetical protein
MLVLLLSSLARSFLVESKEEALAFLAADLKAVVASLDGGSGMVVGEVEERKASEAGADEAASDAALVDGAKDAALEESCFEEGEMQPPQAVVEEPESPLGKLHETLPLPASTPGIAPSSMPPPPAQEMERHLQSPLPKLEQNLSNLTGTALDVDRSNAAGNEKPAGLDPVANRVEEEKEERPSPRWEVPPPRGGCCLCPVFGWSS